MRKARGLFGLIGSVFAAGRAVQDVRAAKGRSDKLLLANAIATVLVVVTGGAIAFRDLRKERRS